MIRDIADIPLIQYVIYEYVTSSYSKGSVVVEYNLVLDNDIPPEVLVEEQQSRIDKEFDFLEELQIRPHSVAIEG
jgi:hypothetical protein